MVARKTHRVSKRKELEVLASPARLELLGLFEAKRELSVQEMAAELGKPVASLYFHVHKLVDAGLLVERGQRGDGRRAQTTYAAIAERVELPLHPASRASREAAAKTVRAILRQAEREFAAAVEGGHFATDPPASEHGAACRQRAWLTPEEFARVGTMLSRIEAYLSRRGAKREGVPVSWTTILVPLAPQP